MVQLIARKRLFALLSIIAIALVSAPMARISVNSVFGLGSLLVVPALAVGIWGALAARDAHQRAWWFGFAVVIGFCLPLCPRVERWLSSLAIYLQDLSQSGTLSLSQRVIEPTLLILTVLCPLVAAWLLGIVAGRIARWYACTDASAQHTDRRWRFSIRELLFGIGATCLLLAWIGSQTRNWEFMEQQKQNSFLTRFKSSFTSGDVKLLGEPTINEQQRTFISESQTFRAPSVNEYRVIAPIEK